MFSFPILSSRPGAIAMADTRLARRKTGPFPSYPPAALLTDGNRFLIAAAAECCLRTVQPSTSGGFRKRIISTPSPLSTVLPKCSTIPLTFSFVRIRDLASCSSPVRVPFAMNSSDLSRSLQIATKNDFMSLSSIAFVDSEKPALKIYLIRYKRNRVVICRRDLWL